MYQYDSHDQAMVDARVEEFRDQARRRLEGKLTEDQFKPAQNPKTPKPQNPNGCTRLNKLRN